MRQLNMRHWGLKAAAAIIALCASFSSQASGIKTKSFAITITENCPEGEIGCEDVSYVGTSLKTGKSIRLKGSSVMRLCADGVTPCGHEGYRFMSGKTEYRILADATLVVSQGKKILVNEAGEWQ